MNVSLIILIIVILVLVLYLIYYVQSSYQVLTKLSESNPSIANKDIVNPTSVRFSYNMWLYVNSWGPTQKTICLAQTSGNVQKFKMYLDANTPTLYTDIYTTDKASPTKTVQITNNFPVQRWVYIVVSVDGNVVDCYLDGKLVKSQQLPVISDMTGDYSISHGIFDAFLTKFSRTATPSDPQLVWNNYMAGNGYSNSGGPAYGFNFVITKDQAPIAQYQYQ